jgi:biopolymer transport protein ExbD
MQIPSSTDRASPGASMTPMIDVVFLLIIFFLVSSHLARQENRLPLNLPLASTFDPVNPEKAPLTISIDREARIRVAGKYTELDSLRTILVDLSKRSEGGGSIRIRTDGAVQYQFVEPVLREAARAGVTDAAIAVYEDDQA